MKTKELRSKTKDELRDMLARQREELRVLRFKVANKEAKNVRELREARKTIGRILTLLNANRFDKLNTNL